MKTMMIVVIVMIALVAIGGICFNLLGSHASAKEDLSLALEKWTSEWQNGDPSSLSEGLIFGVSDDFDDEKIVLSPEEFKTIMEEQYGDLIEDSQDENKTKDLFSILMKYTTITYELPSKVADGQTVSFEISGPDLTKMIASLDENATQEVLFEQLEQMLQTKTDAQRTVSVAVQIVALDDGYMLKHSYELMDGLYGGLLGIFSESLSGGA